MYVIYILSPVGRNRYLDDQCNDWSHRLHTASFYPTQKKAKKKAGEWSEVTSFSGRKQKAKTKKLSDKELYELIQYFAQRLEEEKNKSLTLKGLIFKARDEAAKI